LCPASKVAAPVANISDQMNSAGFANRLDGDYFPVQDQTVCNDSSQDTLTGSARADWFFAGTADKVTELSDADKEFLPSRGQPWRPFSQPPAPVGPLPKVG
jgi:hypothetical protein